MLFQSNISHVPFHQWLYKDPENKRLLIFAALVITIQFIWFKIDCPYPNFIPDSYSYLTAAYNNDFIHIRPIGYSKFLRFFSGFTSSHLALVAAQYLFLQASILYFFLSTRYLFSPGKWLLRVLVAFTVLNPLLLRLANFITSDCLFTILSLLWFTQLLWIVYRSTPRLLVAHTLVLLLAFTVRYNALYYPALSILIILLAPMRRLHRKAAIGAILLLLGVFIGRTQYEYQKRTSIVQFSAFGGWQLAINALYAYAHEPLDSVKDTPFEFQELHGIVNRHMDSLSRLRMRPDASPGIYYLSDPRSPLNVYQQNDKYYRSIKGATNRWLLMGPLYGQYGNYLAAHHRTAYIRYFLLPNLGNYFTSVIEFMGPYAVSNTRLDPVVNTWFRYTDDRLYTYPNDPRLNVIRFLPLFFCLTNFVFVIGLAGFMFTGGFRNTSKPIKRMAGLVAFTWLCNMGFSVLASVIVLRYQVFPMILLYTFAVLFWSYTWQRASIKALQPNDIPTPTALHPI